MKYAINNWVYNDEPLRDTFARLSRYGYDGVELKGAPQQFPAAEVKSLIQEFGLPVPSVLGWNIYPIPGRDLATPDQAERSAALRYGQDCLDYADQIGARVFVVIPAPANRLVPVGNPQGESAWMEAATQRMGSGSGFDPQDCPLRSEARHPACRGADQPL